MREAIEKVGALLLFLPPYSPDFDPIEMASSKLKALLRKAAARTVDELWSVVDGCLAFTHEECRHFFEAAGYDPDQVEDALRHNDHPRNPWHCRRVGMGFGEGPRGDHLMNIPANREAGK